MTGVDFARFLSFAGVGTRQKDAKRGKKCYVAQCMDKR